MARDLITRDTDYTGRTGDITDREIVPYFVLPATIPPIANTTTPATNQSGFSLTGNINLPFFGQVPTMLVIGGALALLFVFTSGSGGRR